MRSDVSEREAARLYDRARRLDKQAAEIMERRQREGESATARAKAYAMYAGSDL